MKFYSITVNGEESDNESLSLSPVDMNLIDYFNATPISLKEPVLIQAHYYNKSDKTREDDYVCAGNPQIVSEDFKNLVERLDPQAAQFFTTKAINCVTEKKYYVMHVTRTISCLDKKHSVIFPPIGIRKENIAIGILDSSKIPPNVHLFRLEEDTSLHYVSEIFCKEFKKQKLRGCIFNLRTVKQ